MKWKSGKQQSVGSSEIIALKGQISGVLCNHFLLLFVAIFCLSSAELCNTDADYAHELFVCNGTPQWGAADTEIKVPSGENTELKCSPFKAWSKSVYSHTCYAYCQGFLSCLFL